MVTGENTSHTRVQILLDSFTRDVLLCILRSQSYSNESECRSRDDGNEFEETLAPASSVNDFNDSEASHSSAASLSLTDRADGSTLPRNGSACSLEYRRDLSVDNLQYRSCPGGDEHWCHRR